MPRVAVVDRPINRAPIGDSLNLNGTSGYALVPDATQIDFTGSWSFGFWVFIRTAGEAGAGRIFEKASAYSVVLLGGGIINAGNAGMGVSSNSNLWEIGKWIHVGGVFNTNSNTIQFYKNGVAYGSAFSQAVDPATNTNPLYIGNRSADDRTFDGYIHELLLFNGTKTAAEMKAYYLRKASEFEEYRQNLAFWGYCVNGINGIYADASDYANSGTITTATISTFVPFGARVPVSGRVLASGRVFTPGPPETISMFGDSYTQGVGATTEASRYPNIFASSIGITLDNQGIGGQQAADVAKTAFTNTIPNGKKSTMMIGLNDMRKWGTNVTNQTYATESVYAAAIWLAMPEAHKIRGQSSLINYTGSWIDSTTIYGGVLGKQSTVSGDTATCVINGTTAYVCVENILAASGATFTVHIDGVSQGSYDAFTSNTTANGLNNHAHLIRYSGLSAGNHTILITITNTHTLAVLFFAGNGRATSSYPTLYVADVIRMFSPDGYAAGGFNVGSDVSTASYNSIISTMISELVADGLQLIHVPTKDLLQASLSNYDTDKIHPNDTGHNLIAQAFITAYIP